MITLEELRIIITTGVVLGPVIMSMIT